MSLKATIVVLMFQLVYLLAWLGATTGLLYAAFHFISKYW